MATVFAEKTNHNPPKPLQTQRAGIIGFFALLFIIDCYLYFWNPGHFFQADSVYLLSHRATSVTQFLREFIKLHNSGWYRPLANETIESILFPIFGLNPAGYRIPVYALFIADTIAVYALALAITRRQIAAVIATFFFNVHTTNAFTTYDVGFTPELLYTLFYLGSVLAYLRYLDYGTKSARRISLACFVGSLCSKEAAVTLPLMLVAVHWFIGARSETGAHTPVWRRLTAALQSTRGHFFVLILYAAFVVAYLHVAGITLTSVLEPKEVSGANYEIFLDKSILNNADMALTWAFNIPRGWMAGFRHVTPAMVTFLKIFRGLVVVLLLFLLFNGERAAILFGLTWFFLTVMPALPLRDHFLYYYLFLPITGFSMMIGTAFARLYESLRSIQRFLPAAILVPIFAGVLYVCGVSVRHEIQENPILGVSARWALNSINELKQLYPALRPDAIIYIDDSGDPDLSANLSDALIRMAYNVEKVSVLYSSLGDALATDSATADKLIVLRLENGHLVDNTAAFRSNPQRFAHYNDSDVYVLTVSASEVTAGRDSYSIRITAVRNVPVRIRYTLNDGTVEEFSAQLDDKGEARFEVSPDTRKGVYRFVGFNIEGQTEWIRSRAAITVR
jgi:hypothetical protein